MCSETKKMASSVEKAFNVPAFLLWINILSALIYYSIDYIFYSARNNKTTKLFVKQLGELSIDF